MAIVKGPLMSLDARGQVGKSVVFIGWKGIKTLRQHVVPANPNTDPQKAQRGIMRFLVALWKTLPAASKIAWNYWSAFESRAMSGFNAFTSSGVVQAKVALTKGMVTDATLTPGDEQVTIAVGFDRINSPGTPATSADLALMFGTDERTLAGSISLVFNDGTSKWDGVATPLTNDVEYAFRVIDNDQNQYVSGLFYATPTA